MFTAASGPVAAADTLMFDTGMLLCFVPRHPSCRLMRTCLLAVPSVLVVFYVLEVGSGKPVYNAKLRGTPPTKKKLTNAHHILKKLRHALYSGTCAPCALAL